MRPTAGRCIIMCRAWSVIAAGITAGFEPAGGGYAEYVRVLPIGLMFTRRLQLHGAQVIATDLLARPVAPGQKIRREVDAVGCKLQVAGCRFKPGRQPATFNFQPATTSGRRRHRRPLRCRRVGGVAKRARRRHGAALRPHQTKPEIRDQRSETAAALADHSAFRTPNSAFPLDLASVCVDEKDLIGSYSANFTLQPEVARLVFSRRLDVRPLLTHRFPLAETTAAIRLAAQPQADSLKVLVTVAED